MEVNKVFFRSSNVSYCFFVWWNDWRGRFKKESGLVYLIEGDQCVKRSRETKMWTIFVVNNTVIWNKLASLLRLLNSVASSLNDRVILLFDELKIIRQKAVYLCVILCDILICEDPRSYYDIFDQNTPILLSDCILIRWVITSPPLYPYGNRNSSSEQDWAKMTGYRAGQVH